MILDTINLIEGSINHNLVFTNVTEAQRTGLLNVESGEVVYQTDGVKGTYIYSGTAWSKIDEPKLAYATAFSALPVAGSADVLYITRDTGTPYYWNGTTYISLVANTLSTVLGTVSADYNTLKKLYDLVVSNINEVTVATIAERDAISVTHLPLNVFVSNAGDGKWALYKATTVGTGTTANFVTLSDPDLLNGVLAGGAAPELAANKSTDVLLGGASANDTLFPTQKAVRAYVNARTDDYDTLPVTIFRRSLPNIAGKLQLKTSV